jgi:broad specificity phosphatase PhoE
MPAPVIYYIRHGETSWNALGRLQGAQDIELNDLGRKQAAHAGNILADLFASDGRDKSSLAFVASPLIRARATMELVRGSLKLPHDGYALDDRLREIGKWTVSPPGGESYVEVQARMQDWYASVAADTVAVAHGGTARALMVALGIETPISAADLTIEQGAVYVFRDGALRKYS